jgi:ribose transport system ATP-binding protein
MFPALIAKGISFGFDRAKPFLQEINVTVEPGQIHAVVGLSGAGKTVLADLLGGVTRFQSGSMHLHGQLIELKSEADATAKTIRTVKQTLDRQSKSTVAEALQMEVIPRKFGLVDMHALVDQARGQLSMFGLDDIDPKGKVCELPAGKQKLLQIASVLSKSASLLILDDPTAALTDTETGVLFQRLSQLQYAETGVLYFTSRAEEALQVGDQISVLREGRLIATHDPTTVFAPQIAGEMIGRDTSRDPIHPPRTTYPEVALRAEGICVEHCVYGLSLKVRRGEVLGLLGLQGAGQSEVVRAICGVEPRTDGEVYLRASALPSRIKSREDALASGIGYVPEPRGRSPIAADQNLTPLSGRVLRSMNGENPQRSAIARCLKADCSVLIFDNPTGGLNVACRLEVQRAIQDIAEIGVSIVAASTDAEELIGFCDRIAVMVDGRIIRSFEKAAFSLEKIQAVLKTRK